MKTSVTGKDATLEQSIEHFQTQLNKLGFNIEEVASFNPVPNVWSVQIRDVDAPMNATQGKGTTQRAALASALGKFFECLSTHSFYNDYYLGQALANSDVVHYNNEKWFDIGEDNLPPEGMLDERLTQYYDPTLELLGTDLVDLQSSNMDRGVCCLPFERQFDNETVYIPANIISNLYLSNGIAAGNTQAEARTQCLSEIIARAIKNRIILKDISLPVIPAGVMARYPAITESIAALAAKGLTVTCYDASLGGEFPVLCAMLAIPGNDECLAAFEAHPHFDVALERAVTELLQNDTLIELGIYPQPVVNTNCKQNEQAAHTPNFSCAMVSGELFKADASYDFVDWNFTGSSEEAFSHLMVTMTKARADVYIADYSHLGVNCCRIIVPSWSEIYPIETLIESNNNVALELRETLLALPNVDWEGEQYAEMYGILEEEGYDDSVLLAEIIGLAPQVGDAWQTLRIGEVKCLLALAGGDLELALELATWCIEVNATTYNPERSQFFHCLVASLNLALDEESDPAQAKADFEQQYGVETVAAAWGSIEGTVRFYGVTGGDLTMSQYPSHQQLLSSYQKLHITQ